MIVRSFPCRVKAGGEQTFRPCFAACPSIVFICICRRMTGPSVFAQLQLRIFLDGASKKKFPNLSEPNAACIAVAPSQRSPLSLIPIKQEAR